jgi:hypothetical protein
MAELGGPIDSNRFHPVHVVNNFNFNCICTRVVLVLMSTLIYVHDGVMPEGCGGLVRNLENIPNFEGISTIQQGELSKFTF